MIYRMAEVEWRDCKRFPEKYIISSEGEIISPRGRTVGKSEVNGYNTICIYDDANKKISNHYIHVLVYETFNDLPTPNGLYSKKAMADAGYINHYIEHIDNDKKNNSVANLRLNDVKKPPIHKDRDLLAGVQLIAKLRKGKRYENREQAYKSTIQLKGVKYHLGTYDNEEDAHEAYRKAYYNYYKSYPPV